MLFPASKFGDMVIGVDAHAVLGPPPASVPIPFTPHPNIGTFFLWWSPKFPSMNVFVNGVPALTVGAKSISFHFPTPPGVWWPKLPCPASFFLSHYTTVALSTMFSLALNTVGAMTGTAVPTSRTPASQMNPPPPNPDMWGALSQQISSYSWGTIIRTLLPPVILPIAEADINMGSPTVTVNGGPMAAVAPLFAGSCSDLPIVPNANVLGFSNVMVGISLKEILMQLAWNAVHGAAALGASRIGRRVAGRITGEPIDVVSGANICDPIDFDLPGPPALRWTRHYCSIIIEEGPLGWGWTHDYQRTLDFKEEFILFTDEEGRSHLFPALSREEPEFEIATEGLRLRRITSECYEMTRRDEPTMVFGFIGFAPRAHLIALRHEGRDLIRFGYDPSQRLVEIENTNGLKLVLTYSSNTTSKRIESIHSVTGPAGNGLHFLAGYEYDHRGDLVTVIDAHGNRATYTYNENHHMTQKTDRRGYSFHYTYNEAGQCIKSWGDDGLYSVELSYFPGAGLTQVIEPSRGIFLYKYNENFLVTGIVDPYGNTTVFQYDKNGNLVTEIDPYGKPTTHAYDEKSRPVERTDSLGGITTWKYDAPGAVCLQRTPDGKADRLPADGLGNELPAKDTPWEKTQTPVYEFDVWGRCIATTIGWRRTSYFYDNLNNLVRVNHPDGTSEANTFDSEGNILTYTDRMGHTWCYTYDSWNKLVQEIDPEGNRTHYGYNRWDQLIRVEDPNGNVTEYERDLNNRLVAVSRNGRLQEQYVLNKAGRLIQRLGADGEKLLTIKRGAGHAIQEKCFSSGQHIRLKHDTAGRMVQAVGTDFSQRRDFDADGNLILEEIDGWTLEQSFGENGLCSESTIGVQWRIVRQHDPQQNCVTISDPLGQTYELTYKDRMVSRRKTSWALEERIRTKDGRIIEQVTSDPCHRLDQTVRYAYDANGALISRREGEEKEYRFFYDQANRLAAFCCPDGRAWRYKYDRAGNLIRLPGHEPLSIGEGNQLQGWHGVREQYDARGNLIQRRQADHVLCLAYNSHELLEQVTLHNGKIVRYRYDALRRRISKSIDDRQTDFLWEGDRLVAERQADQWLRIYIYALPTDLVPLAMVDYCNHHGKWQGRSYCIHTNHLHTPVAVTDEQCRYAWAAELTPYGAVREYGAQRIEFNLRLPGHYFDKETGFHYNRHRYYDPGIGRYLQQDPIGLAGGINTYAYTTNPLSEFDFLGLSNGNGCGGNRNRQDSEDGDAENNQQGTANPRPRRTLSPQEQAGYPPRCAESDAAAQTVIDAINATGRRARDRRVMVTAVVHDDGTVAVGISGRNSQALIDDVRGRLPDNYVVNDATQGPLPSARDPNNPDRIYPGGQNCSEPRAWNASRDHNNGRIANGQPPSSPESQTNQWNPVPTDALPQGKRPTGVTSNPPDSDYYDPCPNCEQNSQQIRGVAMQRTGG